MELLNAKIKYKAKQFDGNYGPYLGAKATLATGETVGLFSNDLEDRQFLALKPGQAIQLIAEEKRGKTKYKPVYPQESEQPQSQQPQPTADASDRFSELLNNFAIAYERVSDRFLDAEFGSGDRFAAGFNKACLSALRAQRSFQGGKNFQARSDIGMGSDRANFPEEMVKAPGRRTGV